MRLLTIKLRRNECYGLIEHIITKFKNNWKNPKWNEKLVMGWMILWDLLLLFHYEIQLLGIG